MPRLETINVLAETKEDLKIYTDNSYVYIGEYRITMAEWHDVVTFINGRKV